jgi:hypothetical protein
MYSMKRGENRWRRGGTGNANVPFAVDLRVNFHFVEPQAPDLKAYANAAIKDKSMQSLKKPEMRWYGHAMQ